MPKAGLYALLAILGFALVFAFLPSGGRADARTGAELSGVKFRMYPSRDEDAVWSFAAQRVTSDPVAGQTQLSGLSGGQRLLRERDPKTKALTGRETLDARLDTPELSIDDQDTMTTRQARITLVRECAGIDLKGTDEQPVKIEQGQGFSAPIAEIRSPFLSGHAEKLQMSFNFDLNDMDNERSSTQIDTNPTRICRDGQLVPNPRAAARSKEN